MFNQFHNQDASTLNAVSLRRIAAGCERRRVWGGLVLFVVTVTSVAASSASAQQMSGRATSRTSDGTQASSRENTELIEIENPRVRALLQSSNVLGSNNSDDARRTTHSGRPSTSNAKQLTLTESRLKKTPPVPAPIQQAKYEFSASTEDAIATPTVASRTAEDNSAPAQAPSRTMASNSFGNAATTEATTSEPSEAAPAFLDLTSEVDRQKTTSEKPVGEHGAELSIETSPQQVLYRAVAWIVIALCFFSLAALGVRKWQRSRGLLPSSSASSRVIETLSLGPGRAVSFIEIAGHRALVAFDAGGIKQLVLAPPSFDDEMDMEHDREASASATTTHSVQKGTVEWRKEVS